VTALEAIDDLERLEDLSEHLLDVGSWDEFLAASGKAHEPTGRPQA
jgi:hypothetical protein